jgi:hypothetical protein
MRRTQEVVDVGERRLRQHPQRVARDDQNLFVQHALDAQPVGGEFSVRRLVLAEREQRRVPVGGRRVGGEGSVHGMKSNMECRGSNPANNKKSQLCVHAIADSSWRRNGQSVCPRTFEVKANRVANFALNCLDGLAGDNASGR